MDLLHLFICNIIVGQVTIELESLNEHREPEFGNMVRTCSACGSIRPRFPESVVAEVGSTSSRRHSFCPDVMRTCCPKITHRVGVNGEVLLAVGLVLMGKYFLPYGRF